MMHEYFLHKQNSQSFKETASALNAENYQSNNDVVELNEKNKRGTQACG